MYVSSVGVFILNTSTVHLSEQSLQPCCLGSLIETHNLTDLNLQNRPVIGQNQLSYQSHRFQISNFSEKLHNKAI